MRHCLERRTILKMPRVGIAVIVALSLYPATAVAGKYSDELDKCLVSSATDKDKADLIRWLFASLARGQDLRDVFSVSPEQREKLTRAAAQVFDRLFTKDCKSQFMNAARMEGDEAPGAGISALSQAAMARVLNDPAVANGANELGRLIDWSKLAPDDGPAKP